MHLFFLTSILEIQRQESNRIKEAAQIEVNDANELKRAMEEQLKHQMQYKEYFYFSQ